MGKNTPVNILLRNKLNNDIKNCPKGIGNSEHPDGVPPPRRGILKFPQ